MARFILWRFVGVVITIYLTLSLAFIALSAVPGDAAQSAVGQSAVSKDLIARRRVALGLDLPLWQQYTGYFRRLSQGELGVSWMSNQPVNFLISQQLPATVALTASGTLVALALGLPLGVLAIYLEEPVLTWLVRALIAVMLSVPVMLSATLLVMGFASTLHWLPATGQGTLAHLVLPSLAVGISTGAGVAMAVEASLGDIVTMPFSVFARAKGLSRWRTMWHHNLRVGILPVLEITTLQLGYLFTGTVITENLFARQGLGRLLVTAIINKDLPVVLGVILVSIAAYSILHIVNDIGYAWLDPRLRLHGG